MTFLMNLLEMLKLFAIATACILAVVFGFRWLLYADVYGYEKQAGWVLAALTVGVIVFFALAKTYCWFPQFFEW